VGLGAFGAHALKARLQTAGTESTWDTAVHYHLLHAVVLLLLGVWARHSPALVGSISTSGWFFVAGIILFSGSLYGLALGGPRWLGPVTPLGGLAFIAAWLWLLKPALTAATGVSANGS
jgi:uncharacterized membrane protein YgdD (TMEM256/DUF423 family)